ncbi:hypothetical protein RND71_003264 [Anisodus tanguticus]|uniref:Uncharacterized protein n=1 Tax=Anisodus tanguticus TaxID=243964 RepID=A0AAE1SWG2_9SOLA|nr:hypothetical protein RND71_003264 [Anisodus tanguticus]
MPLCKDKTKPSVSPNGVGLISEASSLNERNVSHEQHWNCLKKKHKDLGDQHNEFVDLDSISIDIAIFGDGVTSFTMPLTELAQVNDIIGDDMFDDCITSPNPANMMKNSQPLLDDVKAQVTNKDPSTKLNLPHSEKHVASNLEPQEAIPNFKLSYVSGMWHTLWIREVDVIDVSPLEVLSENFFKKHGDYDVSRLSISQNMTRDAHQELISAVK